MEEMGGEEAPLARRNAVNNNLDPNSLCSDLSSLLDSLSSGAVSSDTPEQNNSYVYPACLKGHPPPPVAARLVSPREMMEGYGNNNEYFPLEDSFSDLITPDRSNSFSDGASAGGGYPMSGIDYPGPNDVMLGR